MANENTNTTVETGAEQVQEQEVKTYTQEEVDRMLQQETDRRVTSALQKQQRKFEAEKAEAEKLRDMDEAQKKEYEFNKRVAELEKREKEFALMENKVSATKVLGDRGLPIQFVDYIVAEDAETMMANINNFEKAWKAALADAVNARLAQPAPKGSTATQTGLTKEQFKKLSISQQAELYTTNPELYKTLAAR